MRRNTATKGFKFKLYQKRVNGRYAVSLVLRYNGQRLLISLPFSATEMQWDANKERFVDDETARNIIKEQKLIGDAKKEFLSQLHPDREVNNMYLDKKTAELLSIVDDYERRRIPFTNVMIEERLFIVLKSSTVEKYLLSHIDKLKVSNRYGTASTFEDLYISLKKFDKNFSKRLFPDIDYDYITHFFENERNSGREVGGIGVNLRALRTLLNSAIKENVGSPETYPFSNQYGTRTGKDTFGLAKEVKTNTRKRYIPFEYLKAFYEFEFETVPHQRSKGFFFFSFFCGGINFTDMANIKLTDIKSGFDRQGTPIRYFTYTRSKTNDPIEIQINDDIQAQIDYLLNEEFGTPAAGYLLPIITKDGMSSAELNDFKKNKRKKLNKYLKEMAAIMRFPEGIQDLSTYFARHSFAMRLFSKTKSIDIVSAGLHHSNTEITKVYLESFGADEVAKVTNNLLKKE